MAIPGVEEYSPAADAWVQRAPLATPVSHFAAAYLDSQVVAFGGQDACTTVALCSNQCVVAADEDRKTRCACSFGIACVDRQLRAPTCSVGWVRLG